MSEINYTAKKYAMLRVIVNTSSAGAKSYYASGLSKEDYYIKGQEQEIIGNWGGKGATILGLKGKVDKDQFASLCDNLNPETNEQLTARQNENRRIGYDLNFHAPKSVSLVLALTKDEKIMSAFRESVHETMIEIEKDMQARVRVRGQNDNRTTGNLVYGEFIHSTSRPVDGVPDPHLHAHCFTFNATYDKVEGKWKAGEFGTIKKDAAYFEAHFHSAFSSKLKELGYGIERTKKGWEIAGIDRGTIEKFSNRTHEIDDAAEAKGITSAKGKDELGARTRSKKNSELTLDELREKWSARLTKVESSAIFGAKKNENQTIDFTGKKKEVPGHEEAAKAVDLALEHTFERKSVAGEREVLQEALKRGYGTCTPDQVKNAYWLKEKDVIKANTKDGTILTTKDAVKEERRLVELATEGKGKCAPIYIGYKIQNVALNKEQRQAVQQALSSKDRVVIIEGGAGTGKTTLMKELAQGCEQAGKKVFAFAPSAEASRGVLKSEGFEKADTVARLVQDKELQKQLKNNVLWVDEAGLLGNKQMNQLLEIAKGQNARVILTGDTRQHTSVERGDALRIMMEKSKVKPTRVTEIQRQKNFATYKEAVKLISEQKLSQGFERLESMGAVKEVADTKERHQELAREYVGLVKNKASVLVVAPTHKEGEMVTNQIRAELKTSAVLKGEEKTFTVQKNLSPTEAEKKDATFYRVGQSVQFHQNAKGFARGSMFDIVGKDERGNIQVRDSKKPADAPTQALPLQEGKKFSIFEKAEIKLTAGDKIRITQNGFSNDKKRLNNGNIVTVKGFDGMGNILASSGQSNLTLDKDHRNFAYGYCTTSHSSQGKTVDHVLIAQGAMSFGATTREQFYVSVSRGKSGISIYTDNKQELKEAVQRSGERKTAAEVVSLAEKQAAPKRVGVPRVTPNLQNQQRLVTRLATLARVHYERARAVTQNVKQVIVKR
jgi:conjugative relaxase-like TrwC/TraI family protein